MQEEMVLVGQQIAEAERRREEMLSQLQSLDIEINIARSRYRYFILFVDFCTIAS